FGGEQLQQDRRAEQVGQFDVGVGRQRREFEAVAAVVDRFDAVQGLCDQAVGAGRGVQAQQAGVLRGAADERCDDGCDVHTFTVAFVAAWPTSGSPPRMCQRLPLSTSPIYCKVIRVAADLRAFGYDVVAS